MMGVDLTRPLVIWDCVPFGDIWAARRDLDDDDFSHGPPLAAEALLRKLEAKVMEGLGKGWGLKIPAVYGLLEEGDGIEPDADRVRAFADGELVVYLVVNEPSEGGRLGVWTEERAGWSSEMLLDKPQSGTAYLFDPSIGQFWVEPPTRGSFVFAVATFERLGRAPA